MKIAILGTRGIPASHGGFETFAEEISTRLAAMGHDMTVVCPADAPRADDIYRGVRLTYIKLPKRGIFSQLLWDAKCFVLSSGRYDIAYMLGTGGAFTAWVPRLFGTAVWINTDGIEWKRTKWNIWGRAYVVLAEALSALFSTLVISDSRAIGDYLRQRYRGIARTHTIAYGAYPLEGEAGTEQLQQWDLQAGQYYIVVCRLEPENHVLEIVRGYEQSHSPYPLVILGNIENPNAHVRELLRHRSNKVRFAGTVYDQQRLVQLRFHARGYLHGHSVGGTNPSLLEAMACSNLVLAHDNVFNREVLGDSGMFFQTEKDLAVAIDAVDEGRIAVDRLRQAAYRRVCNCYRWEQIAEAYDRLIQAQGSEKPGNESVKIDSQG